MKPTDVGTISAEFLRSILKYDPETGLWTYRRRARSQSNVGDPAGHLKKKDNRRRIVIRGKSYLAARLAYLYMTGEWPPAEIDHDNRDSSDDRWDNLIPATGLENLANKGNYANNKSGYKGVCYRPTQGDFIVYLRRNNKQRFVGTFKTAENAAQAFLLAEAGA